MWFHRKNTRPAYSPPSSAPTSHRRVPAIADTTLHDWITADADWLEESATGDEAQADALMQRAARKRTLAAQYRPIAARWQAPSPFETAVQAPAHDEPPAAADPAPEPDLSRHNPTWQIPQQERADCGCAFWLGESCALCDATVSARITVTSPWSPPAAEETVTYPEMVNAGWQR